MESSGQSSGPSALQPPPSGQATPPASQATPPVTSESSGAPSSVKAKMLVLVSNDNVFSSDLSDDQLRTRLGHMSSTPCQVIFSMADELCRALGGAEKVEIEWGNHSLSNRVEEAVKELKGSIRVFCRVRPMLRDDGASVEASVICYPTSTESLGRGIDLLQNGNLGIDKSGLTAVQLHWQKHQFTFDKVFTHESSQQDVFVEISQLVQSALDGYKATTTTMSSNQSSDVDSIADDPMDAVPTKGLTETCSPTLLTTGNPCLDFFFHILPDTPSQDLIQRLELAWTHNPLTALKLVSHLCGVRGTGKSDKQGFYAAALWLHEHHPKTLALNVRWFAESGYLKGLLEILYRILERLDVRKVAKE
ncbi:hypothetical protein IFM89_024108 [Coptis chinensis]|uniref:Kinesin motor domain-containing protein n=1 Tax=Coptis chinensis TaxID=261450 RepID=A0A835LNP3_9MAGN|nr:hypothetical protein IFM89_024108 [Coptis chinensis]